MRLLSYFKTFGLCVLVAGLVSGCFGATPPTPVFGDVQFGMGTSLTTGSALVIDLRPAADGNVVIDEAWMNMRNLDFIPDNETDSNVEFEGPYAIALVEGNIVNRVTPEFGTVSMVADTYTTMNYQIAPITADEMPEELDGNSVFEDNVLGHSIYVEGAFQESAGNDIDDDGLVSFVPFRFVTDLSDDYILSIPNGFVVGEDDTSFAFMAMRLPNWFKVALTPMQALTEADLTDGTAVLVADSNSAAIRSIVSTVESKVAIWCKFAEGDDENFNNDDVQETSSSALAP